MASGERSQALYSKGFVRRHHQGHQVPHILFEARPEETGQAGARSQTRIERRNAGTANRIKMLLQVIESKKLPFGSATRKYHLHPGIIQAPVDGILCLRCMLQWHEAAV
jgi:hypothetical protein